MASNLLHAMPFMRARYIVPTSKTAPEKPPIFLFSSGDYPLDPVTRLPQDFTWFAIPVGGAEMKRINQYQFYQLGGVLKALGTLKSDTPVQQFIVELHSAKIWLRWLLGGNLGFFLSASRDPANKLLNAILGVLPDPPSDSSSPFPTIDPERKLSLFEHYFITDGLKEFEIVFGNELPTAASYTVTKKGIYETPDLIERADNAIDATIKHVLDDNAIEDFRQAGKCLAFELPTAAGFHTMRSVEAVLRKYWFLVQKPNAGARPPEMAQCINELRARGENPKLLDILDHIRDLHRNTIMHPEAFLEIKDALGLFDIAKSAISAMGDRIKVLEAAAPSGAAVLGGVATP